MKFIRASSSIHYEADFQNHLSFLPPIEILKRTISSADEKGKTTIIDDGVCPLDGQFCKYASYSTNDDSATQDSAAKASNQFLKPLHHEWWLIVRFFYCSDGRSKSQVGQASVYCYSSEHDCLTKHYEEESLLLAWSLRLHLGYSVSSLQWRRSLADGLPTGLWLVSASFKEIQEIQSSSAGHEFIFFSPWDWWS